MPNAEWDGTERRAGWRALAEEAAALATQEATNAAARVAADHTRQVAVRAFVAALVAALLISLPVVLLVVGHSRDQARADAYANCQLTAGSRPQGNARAFVEREILEVATDALDLFPRRFQAAENAKITRELVAEASHIPGVPRVMVTGFASLGTLVSDLPLITCKE